MIPSPIFAARLQQHHKVPHTPTKEERLQAYRRIAPAVCANGYRWPHLSARSRPGSQPPSLAGAVPGNFSQHGASGLQEEFK